MDKTTAAHFSLRQQKITLANRPSPGQPITTSPGSVQPLLVIPLHAFIKQAGNRSNSILRLSIKKPCYNSYPRNERRRLAVFSYRLGFARSGIEYPPFDLPCYKGRPIHFSDQKVMCMVEYCARLRTGTACSSGAALQTSSGSDNQQFALKHGLQS